ncbi:MAG: hypothetical protein GXP56_19555 [Deltaproteobacteria bacterium]|nr:hypothetical protein [Deltaproteobacteria bacterium]
MSGKTKKIILLKTVLYKGRHYPPGSEQNLPVDIVDDLIEKKAAEPVMAVKPEQEPEPEPKKNQDNN